MYEYRIAVPAQHADEIENVLRGEAEVRTEGIMPTPEEMAADKSWAIQSGAPLAILSIESPTLQSVVTLKNWVEQRFADPYVDIRVREPSGAFSFSFRAHSAEETKDWIEKLASGRQMSEWTRRPAKP